MKAGYLRRIHLRVGLVSVHGFGFLWLPVRALRNLNIFSRHSKSAIPSFISMAKPCPKWGINACQKPDVSLDNCWTKFGQTTDRDESSGDVVGSRTATFADQSSPVCRAARVILTSQNPRCTLEAPARHKGGIASRRNYSCETAQLFASWIISIFDTT